MKAGFVRQIEELTGRLNKILRDTLQVKEAQKTADQEMMADLYYRIAKGYKNNPEVTKKKKKKKKKNFFLTEASSHVASIALSTSFGRK